MAEEKVSRSDKLRVRPSRQSDHPSPLACCLFLDYDVKHGCTSKDKNKRTPSVLAMEQRVYCFKASPLITFGNMGRSNGQCKYLSRLLNFGGNV